MKLGKLSNMISCEYEMQDKMKEWLGYKKLIYVDEKRIKEVSRIADFLVIKGNKLINIEAKCNDFDCMLKQLNSHSLYCDYSFAFIPDYPLTPKWFKKRLTELNYGLIVYNTDLKIITEVLEAHYNKPKLKDLRKYTIKYIQEINE